MSKSSNIFLFVFACLLLGSCGLFRHGSKSVIEGEDKIENTAEYIDGCKDKMAGEYDKALTHFATCAKKDKSNPAPLYEIAQIYYYLDKTESAMPYIKKARELDPLNEWYQLLEAELLVAAKNYKEAAAVYKKLSETYPGNTGYIIDWASACLFSAQYNEALEAFNKLEEKAGITEEISLQKEKIYLLQNKFSKAVEEIQKLVYAYPSEIRYLNYLADLYMAKDMPDEAMTIYENILKIDPSDGDVHLSLAEYYRMKGNNSESYEEIKKAFSNSAVDIDAKILILLSYYTLTEKSDSLKDQAYELCGLLVETHSEEAKSYSIYGDFLIRDNKIKDAKEQYLKVISLDSSRYAVWEQLLNVEYELKEYTALENESNRALELFPEQAGPYLMNGAANYLLKKYDKAINTLNKGVELAVFDESLLKNFYSYLGDAYHANKQIKEAYASYDKVLDIDPSNVYVLNNYSYYLALQNEELGKAEKMAAKAVSIEPSNTSYLDTYAWTLFRQQRFAEAESNLKKALDGGGDNNGVILEHYGDVQYKLDNKEKALEYWNKAKSTGRASELLDKKIADGKYYESNG